MTNDVTKMAFFAPDPKLMVVDFADLDKKAAKMRAERDAANPPKPEPIRVEYNRLRKELYDLQQHAKNCEVRVNNEAANVKHWERNIEDLLKRKKKAVADNMLGEERSCERQIEMAETELLDARERLAREQRINSAAVRELKAFPHVARLEALKVELDRPKVVSK